MAKKKSSPLWIVVALVVAGISWYMKQQEAANPEQKENSEVVVSNKTKNGTAKKAPAAVVVPEDAPPAQQSAQGSKVRPILVAKNSGYALLKNCRLVDNRRNDGDSFFVRHADGETEFRLYFLDTPESKYKEYRDGKNNGERLQQQGRYFNGLNRDETVAVGSAAKTFVKKVLSRKPFKVMTKWESVFGSERCYAFVVFEYKGKERYLHEVLTEEGLGRIHTSGRSMPDGRTTQSQQKSRLKNIERKAKQSKRGAWGI